MGNRTTQVQGTTTAPPFLCWARAGRQLLASLLSAQSTEKWPEFTSPLKSDPIKIQPAPDPLSPRNITLSFPLTSS